MGGIVIERYQAASGLWIGDIEKPSKKDFQSVLTIAPRGTPTDEGLRHRHLPIPGRPEDVDEFVEDALSWIENRWGRHGTLLVQSPGGLWAELLVAATFVDLGATPDEAILSLRLARPKALPDQQLFDHLLNGRGVYVRRPA